MFYLYPIAVVPKVEGKIKKTTGEEKSTWGQSNAKMLKFQADDDAWQCSFCGDLVPKKELMTHLNYCLKAADLIMGIKCTECHQDQFKSKHEVYGHILEGFLETHDANVQFEVRGTAKNHQEIEQGKTTINDGLPPLMPPRSILQKQAKTKVLPVLPTTTPLKVIGNAEAEHSVTIHLPSLQ